MAILQIHWVHPPRLFLAVLILIKLGNVVSQCPSPPALSGMTTANYSDNTTGSTAIYSCLEGYVHVNLTTSFVFSCNDQGVWEGPNTTCHYVDCGSPPPVPNTTVTFDRSSYLGIANYTCLPGNESMYLAYAITTCSASGNWTVPTIDCQVSQCPSPPVLSGMTAANYSDNTTGSTAIYSCLEGYVHVNLTTSFVFSCNDQGVWEGPNTTCHYVDCGSPPPVPNTTVTFDRSSYLGIANYTCLPGNESMYLAYAITTCSASGNWTVPTIDCQVSQCPSPPVLSGMTAANYSDNTTGSTAIYSCLEGYVHVNLTTSFVFSCNDQGVWEGPNTTCHYVDCGSPPPVPNTTVTFDRSSYLGIANYTCLPGNESMYLAYAITTCSASGNWTVPTIDCQVSQCPSPPVLSGMTAANYSDNTTGSTAIYSCLEGYVHVNLTTSFVFSCNDKGVWEGPNTTCHYVDCGSPPPVPNTTVTFDRSSYLGIANYTCLPGNESMYLAYAITTCTASGNWTVPTIDCQVSQCPSPPALSGMTAANYSDNTTGSTAIYSCLEGYVHVNLTASFVFSCNDQGVWEGPNATCHYVECGSPLSIPNTTVTYNKTSYQGTANYTCLPGYYWFTDPRYANITCTASGHWTVAVIDCQQVDCGPPPNVNYTFMEFNGSSGYLDRAVYQCYSGYSGAGGVSRFTLTCSQMGSWTGPNIRYCLRDKMYLGCHIAESATTLADNFTASTCKTACLDHAASFAMMKGGECACAQMKPSETVLDLNCNMKCDKDTDQLCGGDPDLWSVYSIFHGCFSAITKDGMFWSHNRMTCHEFCHGQDSRYAAYFELKEGCVCLNSPQPGASYQPECSANETELALISTLDIVERLSASSCEQLYGLGVRVHGLYYLSNDVNPTYCSFYDGTANCTTGWLSYNKHCYRFFNASRVTFREAWTQCFEQDSHLITITSEEEASIVDLYYQDVPYFSSKYIFLGMYNHFGNFDFKWLDESLVRYTEFYDYEPRDRPFVRKWGTIGSWTGDYYTDTVPTVICERSLGTYGCMSLPDNSLSPVYTFEDSNLMTLTFCFETCRGVGTLYAAVMNGTLCQCLSSLPLSHTKVAWTSCDITCVGNAYQLCGGHPNVTADGQIVFAFVVQGKVNRDRDCLDVTIVFAFVVQDVGQPPATSCLDLGLQGISGSRFIVNNAGNISVVNCTAEISCPYGFAPMSGRCYKYVHAENGDPAEFCHRWDSYLVVIDSHQEFINVFGDTRIMRGRHSWIVGLFAYRGDGIYRSSSGRALKGLDWVPDTSDPSAFGLFLSMDSSICVLYNLGYDYVPRYCYGSFVCEKGSDYRGCGVVNESVSTLVLRDYPEMSVIQCVELCRGRVDKFALIANNPFRCYCTNEEPEFVSSSKCNGYCFESHQACGGSAWKTVSVYEVDKLPALAESCSDLFDMDVMVPGTYLVNGTPAYCYMKDNSSCSLPNTNEWEGVAQDGVCFKWSFVKLTDVPTASMCQNAGSSANALHWPASIRSVQERLLLQHTARTFKDVFRMEDSLLGGVDQFLMGTFTWADGWLMTLPASDWDNLYPDLDYGKSGGKAGYGYLLLSYDGYLKQKKQTSLLSKMICREISDHLGCVINPSTLTPIISNYSSMSIALCKQTCLAQYALLALLDTGSCYCSDDLDLAGFTGAADTQAGCDVHCPGNSLQRCADPGFLRAYRLNTSDVADSCEILYANFVMLNNTYILRNLTAKDSNATVSATCSMSDFTPCPAGFLGNKGSCYRFFPRTYMTRFMASSECFSFGSYLATPSNATELAYLLTAVARIPSLSNLNHWRFGVYDRMQGQLLPSSDGSLLVSPMWDTEGLSSTEMCAQLDVSASSVARGSCRFYQPFVCEIGPEFVGCRSFQIPPRDVTSTKTFDLFTTSITVQQCLALCFGQDRRYALLTTTKCYCGNSDVIDTMHSDVKACQGCSGYYSQACGVETSGIYAVYDADVYSLIRKSAQSCSQYRQVLVTARGQYYLYLNSTSTLLVTCGTYGSGHDDILLLEGNSVSYAASSATASQVRLNMEALAWTSWQPDNDDTRRWIQVTLSDYHIIKAVVFSGSPSGDGGHVTKLAVSFWLTTYMETMESTLAGPSQRSALAVRYLPLPVVAKVVRLQPVTWSVDPSLSFTLLGQRYANFIHFDRYIGCFADPSGTALVSLVQPVTEDGCKDHCSQQGYPLFGVVSSSGLERCGCADTTGEYGELDVTSCSSICGGLPCGDDEAMSMTLFRAYDKRCSDPPEVINTTQTLTSLVPTPDGVYGTGSNVTYTCPTGYGMTDMMLNIFTITCQQNNTWGPVLPDACQVVTCRIPDDIPHCHELYTNVTYGHNVTYMCHAQYETEDGDMRKVSYCTHGGTWQPPPPQCHRQELRHRDVCHSRRGLQIVGSNITPLRTRSKMDCALHCMNQDRCVFYNFASGIAALPAGMDNCRLYAGPLQEPDFLADPNWDVYELGLDC